MSCAESAKQTLNLFKLAGTCAMLVCGWPQGVAAAKADTARLRARLDSCPQSAETLSGAARNAWAPAKSQIAKHRELRSRLGAAMPRTGTMILVHGLSSHHTTYEWSTVATRDPTGRWHIESVGEERSALLKIETRALPRSSKTLSAARSRRLDALLSDRCLQWEPTFQSNGDTHIEAWISTMEIFTPSHQRVVWWLGGTKGVTGEVADLIIGRGTEK